jgi:hypothetical protein
MDRRNGGGITVAKPPLLVTGASQEVDDMTRQLNTSLDPRLRRLVHAQDDPTRLGDLNASQVVTRDGGIPTAGCRPPGYL